MERAVILAFESLVECQSLGGIPRAIRDEFEYGLALALAVADLDRVHQPRARLRIDGQTVDQHVHRFRKVHIEQRFRRGEFVDAACLIQPVEPALLKIQQCLPKRILRRTGRRFLPTAFRIAGRCRPGNSKLVQHVKAAPRRERQNPRGNFVGAVPAYLRSAFDAKRLSAAREEQPEVVVNFRGRGHDRTRVPRGVLLANGYRGRDTRDFVHVRLFHALEKLPRVGGERLDVAALALGINRVEGKRGLARSAHAGDHGNRVMRNFHAHVFEVVYASAADADGLLLRPEIAGSGGNLFCRQREAQTAPFERTA